MRILLSTKVAPWFRQLNWIYWIELIKYHQKVVLSLFKRQGSIKTMTIGRSENVKSEIFAPFRKKIHVSIIWHWGKCLKTKILSLLRFRKRILKNPIIRQILLCKMPKFWPKKTFFFKKLIKNSKSGSKLKTKTFLES